MEIKNFDTFISKNYNLVLENMYEYIQKINQKKITITCNLFFLFYSCSTDCPVFFS